MLLRSVGQTLVQGLDGGGLADEPLGDISYLLSIISYLLTQK